MHRATPARRPLALALAACIAPLAAAQTLTTAFTYQGEIASAGSPVSGTYDLRFTLWDAPSGGAQLGSTLCSDNVAVSTGKFVASLDFGSQFAGQRRWLQMEVRADTGLTCANTTGYTVMAPRQELTAGPNALYAAASGNAALLSGQPASFYTNAANLTTGVIPDARLSSNVPTLASSPTWTGIPAFNGGTSGTSAPFSVDSNSLVTNLNADLLDGFDSTAFPRLSALNAFTGSSNTFNAVYTTNARVAAAATSIAAFDLYDNSFGTRWRVAKDTANDFAIIDASPTTDVTRLLIDGATGNIGIAQPAPARMLHLGTQTPGSGNSQGLMRFSSGNAAGNFRSFDVGVRNVANNTATDYDFVIDDVNRAGDELNIDWATGYVGIGTSNPTQKLDVAGNLRCFLLEITGGADLSEKFDIAPAIDTPPAPGMVVCIDPEHPGALRVATSAYDTTVAGIIAGANGVQPGMVLTQQGSPASGTQPVALTGRVWALADATAAPIAPGSLLTTSGTPGHLMKAADQQRAQGATVGKAMTALPQGQKGYVLVLVNLH
ncbi:MAG: hypothetical protein U0637_11775 [Phycisphaerales bacterium]